MKEDFYIKILQQLKGEQPMEVWVAGFIWALIGIFAIKVWFYDGKKFSIVYWLKDNAVDVLKGIIAIPVLLRLGYYLVSVFRDLFILPETKDFVAIMIVVSGYLQRHLHKQRDKTSKKMLNDNEEKCK